METNSKKTKAAAKVALVSNCPATGVAEELYAALESYREEFQAAIALKVSPGKAKKAAKKNLNRAVIRLAKIYGEASVISALESSLRGIPVVEGNAGASLTGSSS